jgi:putative aminopeptidase FrvX
MSTLPPVNREFLRTILVELLNTPSPTGYTHRALSVVEEVLKAFQGVQCAYTYKGALVATWHSGQSAPPRALTAHVDTLGALVKEIKTNGRLKLSKIGGYSWNTVEGEGCTVFTSSGDAIRGTVLLTKASYHIFSTQINETKREDDTMEVRLDAPTTCAEETRALGIEVGDFVAYDPRVEVINGFVRSRHLDDKAGVACMLAAMRALQDASLQPSRTTYFHFSNYEEVGHGASSGIPSDVTELLVVDMAAVGEGQASDEFHASLCVKDSGGPYHYGMSQRMRELAEENGIPYKLDVYPHYGSDGEAYWRAGGDVRVALIGPGVDASHSYERTHLEALEATTRWILAYGLS